jgi:hypothetical protein
MLKLTFLTSVSALFVLTIACDQKSSYSTPPIKKTVTANTAPASENSSVPVIEPEAPKPVPLPAAPVVNDSPAAKTPYHDRCPDQCTGESKIFLNSKYSKWIKVTLCSPKRYDIFMSENQNGPFLKVGDKGGHGQDHCELVNNNFATLQSDDNVKSGNCPTCDVKSAGTVTELPDLFGKKVFQRSRMGEQFGIEDAVSWGIHTSCWYECGVSF